MNFTTYNLQRRKTLRYFIATFIFACITGIATVGLDQAGKYNEVLALGNYQLIPFQPRGMLTGDKRLPAIDIRTRCQQAVERVLRLSATRFVGDIPPKESRFAGCAGF